MFTAFEPTVQNRFIMYIDGIPYGMGAYALGKNINVPTKEAQKLVAGYLNGFGYIIES